MAFRGNVVDMGKAGQHRMRKAGQGVRREELLAHREYVRALARRLVIDPHRADDVAQDALLAALEAPAPPRRGRGRAWLSAVVRNLARRMLRDDERRRRREAARARPARTRATGDVVADLQLHREVVDALLALEEPYRTALVLHFFEGLPPRGIAERQGLPGATVRSHLHRGIEKLRLVLDKRHGGDRRLWCLALLPLAFPAQTSAAAAGATLTTAGALAMSTKSKLSLAALLLLGVSALTVTLVWRAGAPRDTQRATPAARTPVAAQEKSPSGAATENETAAAPLIRLEVRVLDPAGDLADGATVKVYARSQREWPPGLASYGEPWFTRGWQAALGREPLAAERPTDRNGTARFELAQGKSWRIQARKAGCAPAETIAHTVAKPDRPIELRLAAGHALGGQVVDAAGMPVAGATVAVGAAELAIHGGFGELSQNAGTDATGRYCFDNLATGDRSLWVAFPGGLPSFVALVRVPNVKEFDFVLERGGVLTGKVTEKESGRSLGGIEVRVKLEGPPPAFGRGVTNGDGVYLIDTLPAGRVSGVFACGNGYAQEPMKPNTWITLPLLPGDRVIHDLELVRTGTLHGTVRGPDGPLAGVFVEAMYRFANLDHATFQTHTDAAGAYRITNLPAAHYLIRAALRGFTHEASAVALFEAFQPEHVGLLVAVGEGEEVGHSFVLRRGTAAVEGKVVDETGAPLAGAKVATLNAETLTYATGAFRLEGCVPGDAVHLAAALEGYRNADLTSIALAEDATVRNVVLRMQPVDMRELVGRVVAADGGALREPFVLVTRIEEQLPRWRSNMTPMRHAVAPDGAFRVELRESHARLLHLVVQAGALGAGLSDPLGVPITEEKRYEVEIVLPATHRVRGIVLAADGQPVVGARVSIGPPPERDIQNQFLHPHAKTPVVGVSGPEGLFEAAGFAPGSYQLRAWSPGHIDAYGEVAIPAMEPVRVTMEPAFELAGRILTVDGEPIGGIHLALQVQRATRSGVMSPEEAREYHRYGKLHNLWTNAHGEFRVGGLKRGGYRINVGGYFGGPNVARTVFDDVPAGSTDLELVLRPGLEIRGRVVGNGGEGLAGVYVMARRDGAGGGDTRRSDTTGPDGSFRITGLSPGAHSLWMRIRSGRSSREITHEHVPAGAKDVVIQADDTYLPMTGELRGVDGRPLGGVGLRIRKGRRWSPNATVTDARGQFRFEGLDDAVYEIVLDDKRYRDLLFEGGKGVRAGARGVVLRLSAGAVIEGIVRTADGAPVADVRVYARNEQKKIHQRASSDAEGRFRISGLPADVVVVVSCSHKEYALLRRADVRAGARGLKITLLRGIPTTGRIVDQNGRPLSGLRVTFKPAHGDDTVAGATTDDDGRFEVALLEREYIATGKRPEEGEFRTYTCGRLRGGSRDVRLAATRE